MAEEVKTEREPRSDWANFSLPASLIFGFVLLLSLSVEGADEVEAGPLEHWLELVIDYIAFGAEIAAALVIGVAVVQGIFMIGGVPRFVQSVAQTPPKEQANIHLPSGTPCAVHHLERLQTERQKCS